MAPLGEEAAAWGRHAAARSRSESDAGVSVEHSEQHDWIVILMPSVLSDAFLRRVGHRSTVGVLMFAGGH